jgi:lipoprotein-releasing system permease protein
VYRPILIARYLLKRRITHFAIAAVALCVFTVMVVMTVMTGLVGDFKEKNHAFTGDCVVATDSLVGFPYYEEFMARVERTGIAAGLSPVVKSYALFSTDVGGGEDSVEIIGLDPVRHNQVTNFGQTLSFRGKQVDKAFVPTYDPNALGCIVGIDRTTSRNSRGQYARFSGPFPFSVTLTCFPLTAKGALFKASTGLVNTKKFFHSDDCHTGIAKVDSDYVYIPLEQAQLLCMDPGAKRITALHIKFRPEVGEMEGRQMVADLWRQFQKDKAGAPNSGLLETVSVQSWKDYRRSTIAPNEQEQLILSLMFILVGITTVFIVFVVFYMLVNNKRKDIGVLKSVGASNAGVLSLFQGFAFGIGSIGSVAGVLLAWLFLSKINRIEQWSYDHFGIQLWDRAIYVIGEIPHHVELSVVAAIVSFAILSCLVGALVPSYLAVRLRPVETLHAGRM